MKQNYLPDFLKNYVFGNLFYEIRKNIVLLDLTKKTQIIRSK